MGASVFAGLTPVPTGGTSRVGLATARLPASRGTGLVATGEVAADAYLANPASGSTTGTDLTVEGDTYGPGSRPCETVRKENPP